MLITKNDVKWMEKFELFKEFIEKFDRYPYKGEIYKGANLCSWCYNQRQAYRGNNNRHISEERIELLNSIGFIWDMKNNMWESHFKLVKEFIEKFGRYPYADEIYKDANIGWWCSTQRQAYKGNIDFKLSDKRIQMLDSIGFKWNVLESEWMDNFYLVKEFHEKFGIFPRGKKITYKGVNIGIWCETQRRAYRGYDSRYNLTQERMELLNSIEFV